MNSVIRSNIGRPDHILPMSITRISRHLLAICLILGLCAPVMAFRTFPPDVRRGEIVAHEYPAVKIDSRAYRLAPGAKIFDWQNMIMVPTALPDRRLQVLYTVDFNGHLSAIWLLTDEELRRYPLKK
jgi:hypothetical protein